MRQFIHFFLSKGTTIDELFVHDTSAPTPLPVTSKSTLLLHVETGKRPRKGGNVTGDLNSFRTYFTFKSRPLEIVRNPCVWFWNFYQEETWKS